MRRNNIGSMLIGAVFDLPRSATSSCAQDINLRVHWKIKNDVWDAITIDEPSLLMFSQIQSLITWQH